MHTTYDERRRALHRILIFYLAVCPALGFILAQAASFLTTLYLHRRSTHRSLQFHPWVETFMQFWLWILTGINRKEWVAVHLCHHAHADEQGDPHSPRLLGFWRVQLGNIFYYRRAARDPAVLEYAKHITPSLAERTVFKFGTLGFTAGIAILWYALGFLPMCVIAGTHMLFYIIVIPGLVNGLCHFRGYKNFPESPAFNNRLVAWLTAGEGLHNNHHHSPGNPSLRVKRSEIDLGWIAIRLLTSLKLATVSR